MPRFCPYVWIFHGHWPIRPARAPSGGHSRLFSLVPISLRGLLSSLEQEDDPRLTLLLPRPKSSRLGLPGALSPGDRGGWRFGFPSGNPVGCVERAHCSFAWLLILLGESDSSDLKPGLVTGSSSCALPRLSASLPPVRTGAPSTVHGHSGGLSHGTPHNKPTTLRSGVFWD